MEAHSCASHTCLCATCVQAPTEAKRHGMDTVGMQFQSVVTHSVWVLEATSKCSGRGAHLTTPLWPCGLNFNKFYCIVSHPESFFFIQVPYQGDTWVETSEKKPLPWQPRRAGEATGRPCSLLAATRLPFLQENKEIKLKQKSPLEL